MKEYRIGKVDKIIIENCIYKNIGGLRQSENRRALKNIFLNKLQEEGIPCKHLKNNTYQIEARDGTKYLIVIASYSESRAVKSAYTVGKEVADQLKEKLGYKEWYAVFITVTKERELSSKEPPSVCVNHELELTQSRRSSGRGYYYSCAKEKTNQYKLFDKWYQDLGMVGGEDAEDI